jgi:hypothetical protein
MAGGAPCDFHCKNALKEIVAFAAVLTREGTPFVRIRRETSERPFGSGSAPPAAAGPGPTAVFRSRAPARE